VTSLRSTIRLTSSLLVGVSETAHPGSLMTSSVERTWGPQAALPRASCGQRPLRKRPPSASKEGCCVALNVSLRRNGRCVVGVPVVDVGIKVNTVHVAQVRPAGDVLPIQEGPPLVQLSFFLCASHLLRQVLPAGSRAERRADVPCRVMIRVTSSFSRSPGKGHLVPMRSVVILNVGSKQKRRSRPQPSQSTEVQGAGRPPCRKA